VAEPGLFIFHDASFYRVPEKDFGIVGNPLPTTGQKGFPL
jgi:hypothetical protein